MTEDQMIARVFARQTTATPIDDLAFYDVPGVFLPEINEVHVSCTFTDDKQRAELLADEWRHIAPVKVGGPAYDDHGGEFTPGMYLKTGYVFTSRGCPNNCWFCVVPKREGDIRELPITTGHNVLDSNLLACSRDHIESVFKMLSAQSDRVEFTGGLEAARLESWHVEKLWDLRPKQMFFAYDTPDDLEPLVEAGKKLMRADFTRFHLRCYVLIGFPKDSISEAEKRLIEAWDAGFMPMAMLYDNTDVEWKKLQRNWCRPAITRKRIRDILKDC